MLTVANPFCLIPQHASAFLTAIRNGSLDPAKLMGMTSDARHAEFAKVVGDANAGPLNVAFESKLLLKNQQQGIINWIQQSTTQGSPLQRELLAKVERMDPRILNPAQRADFLADLAQQKLGVAVTMNEAGTIASLAKDVATQKAAGNWDGYMDARAAFREYTSGLEGHEPLTIPKGIAALARASVLSWPTTLVKLTSIALSRVVTTPVEDVVAMGVAKTLPGLAAGAPRFGTTSPSVALNAEAAAQAAMWTDGMIDAGRMLMNKTSRLDLAHSTDAHANAMGHAWYDYMGSIHGALKEPIKRAEYARSLYRRTAEAASRGENINDMTVKMRLSTEAFKDGQRAISMQDNKVASAWNAGLRQLESVDKETGKANPVGALLATAARTEMPVMKAPTNVVAEASQYIGGMLTGPAKAAWAYAHGIENLKPVERDAIIREISKGAVGAAIMGLYYFKHEDVQFGGYYQQGEHRKPGDVPADALRVGDVDIPTQLIHHPMFQAAQFAATTAKVAGSKLHKKDGDVQGLASAVGAAAVGLIDQVPIIGQLPRDIEALSDPAQRAEFLPNKAANIAVPGIVQWIAKKTDDTQQPRKATGLTQHLEANVPGLRENVPLKRKR